MQNKSALFTAVLGLREELKNYLTLFPSHDNIIGLVSSGAMAERLKALVLKTSDTERYRGFESLSLRQP